MLTGIRSELLREVLASFYLRFTPEGRVLWVSEEGEPTLAVRDELNHLGMSLPRPRSLPTVVIDDEQHGKLIVIDVADSRGLMTEKRREVLKKMFDGYRAELILVNAFRSRQEFQASLVELPWETVIWLSGEASHLIHFDGERFLGPYPDVLPPRRAS